jgi:hypothetical protein
MIIDKFRWAVTTNPRRATTPAERARLWWKLALRKVIQKLE